MVPSALSTSARVRRLLATWIAISSVVGIGALVPRHVEKGQRVSAVAPTVSTPEITLPTLLPDLTVPSITVPPVTVPRVTLPPITVPQIVQPVLETVQDVLEEVACTPGRPVTIRSEGLWLIDADSGCAQVLHLGVQYLQPEFSPDGTRAVVALPDGDDRITGALWVADLRTGLRTRIIRGDAVGGAAWSPDGRWIAFRGEPTGASAEPTRSGSNQVWIMRPDGTGLRRIAAPEDNGGILAWSRDSRRIATTLINDDQVMVIDVAAGTSRTFPYEEPYLASWSPDGTQLAVSASYRTQTSLMDPDTGATRTIVPGACFPRWSPTGAWIGVARETNLILVRPDGSDPHDLGDGGPINWSSDGRLLLSQGGTSSVEVVDVSTMAKRTVAVAGDKGPWPQPSRWIPGTHRFAVIGVGAVHYAP